MSRRTPAPAPTISLFPFLAVLLCTMGALLVLLVLFSRSAARAGASVADAAIEDLELALENARWRRGQLEEVRVRTADDLSRARMALAGVEENTRGLEDEIDRMAREAEALETAAAAAAGDEIAGLEAKLANARESLDTAREDLARRPAAYAVVPYVGKHGTHRRPLYIECSIDGVYLQPEGIRLAPGDFDGPPGPGNPLASALRAAREHLARTSPNPGDPASQPYPLLLVRPSGVMAYYAAREAIVSWGSEFGYQLIEDDWNIAYPPRDQALAEAESRAVEESRRRLQWLVENQPQRPARPARQYRAAPGRGGVVESGGPSLLGDQAQFEWNDPGAAGTPGRGTRGGGGAAGPGAIAGTPAAAAGGGAGGGDTPGGSAAGAVAPGRPFLAAEGTADDPAGDAVLGGGGRGGASPGVPGGNVVGPGSPGNGPAGTPGGGLASAQSRAAGGPGGDPGGAGGTSGPAGSAGPGDGSANGGDRYGAAGGSAFAAPATGQASADGGSAAGGGSGASGGIALGAAGNGATGGSGGQVSLPGMLGAGAGGGGAADGGGSIASRRGANWASLATRDRPVPLTRPIHVECALAELRILDDTGRRIQSRVPLDGDTASAIDSFVGALHAKVRGWGLAGDRMYWRPELVLTATVDGESRRDDLERLLADSGIDVRPRQPREEVRSLPPVQRASYERLLR